MFDLNEELILEGYNMPWLIWVQLLVTILLLFVLFCGFSIFSDDISSNPSCSASSSSFPGNRSGDNKSLFNGSASFQVEEIRHMQSEADASASKGIVNEEQTLVQARELPVKDVAFVRRFDGGRGAGHPCSYFEFAKEAILKCLGLDALFETTPRKRRHEKNDQQQ